MSLSRADLIFGPARFVLTYSGGSTTWFTEGGETVELRPNVSLMPVRLQGMEVNQIVDDVMVQADIPVDSRLVAAKVAALWPYGNSLAGAGLWTATDYTLTAHGADSHLHTVKSVAVTKMPDITFDLDFRIGSVGIEGLRTNAGDWSTASSVYTEAATGGTYTDSAFTVASLVAMKQPYVLDFGAVSGLTAIDSVSPINVRFNLELGAIKTQKMGTHQRFVRSVSCAVEFEPAGLAHDALLAQFNFQGATASRGRSLDASSQAVAIKGVNTNATHFSLTNGAIHQGSYRFGTQDNVLRDGQLAIVSTRQYTAGAQTALFTITPP